MVKLEDILSDIEELKPDIKAEAVMAQVLEAGVDAAAVFVHTNSLFHRNYSKDILKAALDDGGHHTEALHFYLTRAGLYDLLPEGLFFEPPAAGRGPKNAAEMAAEYVVNKKKEDGIRQFFSPLEHEFFYHRYKNYAAEKKMMAGLSNTQLNQYFKQFWQLPASMDAGMALRTVLLLPYIHQVAGDADLMAACLQTILREPVRCRLQTESRQQTGLMYNVLGGFALGTELTCGAGYEEEDFYFEFTLGPLGRSGAQDYLEGGRLYAALQTFYRFFVPVATHVLTSIQVQPEKQDMHIGAGEEAVLGIATVL